MRAMKRLALIALILGGVFAGAYQIQAGNDAPCAPGGECRPGEACCPEQCDPGGCGTSCG